MSESCNPGAFVDLEKGLVTGHSAVDLGGYCRLERQQAAADQACTAEGLLLSRQVLPPDEVLS